MAVGLVRRPVLIPLVIPVGLAVALNWGTARREIARSLELKPDQPTLRQILTDCRGRRPRARTALQKA